MKRGWVIIWRVVYLCILLLLFLTKTISLDTFLAIIIGIVIFYGIPEAVQMVKGNNDESRNN
ncbi:MAG TPA: hypothetical protein VK067_05685 [Pseudogracilibacillus sp.]|nr:hypothetical protein [Pseudogracilibacillus sp.]